VSCKLYLIPSATFVSKHFLYFRLVYM